MKTLSLTSRSRSAGAAVPCPRRGVSAGFTLVEMLVVIAIIGILAALLTPVVISARTKAKNAVIAMELKTGLEGACQQYKMQFGEYPPDGTDPTAVTRHIHNRFPRYTGAIPSGLTPFTSLTFWLGGMWDGTKFIGFSADQTNPFDATSTSRVGPFFEFDPNRIADAGNMTVGTSTFRYWPQGAEGDRTTGAIAYFRADNGNYWNSSGYPNPKSVEDPGDTRTDPSTGRPTHGIVYPAQDSRLSTFVSGRTPYEWVPVWINPKSFQLFSSGLGGFYSYYGLPGGGANPPGALNFPIGEDGCGTSPNFNAHGYPMDTYDDITNFSTEHGTLQDCIP